MSRTFLAALLISIVVMPPLAAQPQVKTKGSGFGGGFKSGPAPAFFQPLSQIQPIAPIMPIAPFGVRNTGFSAGFNRPGQFRPGLPIFGGGFGGGFPYFGYGYGGYGYRSPYTSNTVNVYPAYYVPVGPAEPDVQLSGLANASLVLQFPADAEVWLDGKKGEGEPQTEWTLTSPALPTGQEYSFDVKARWKKNGKTYEYDKTVAVAAGHRSRSLVLSGTEIKE
jgi:uncharacterized protein (TIGR03000 family)